MLVTTLLDTETFKEICSAEPQFSEHARSIHQPGSSTEKLGSWAWWHKWVRTFQRLKDWESELSEWAPCQLNNRTRLSQKTTKLKSSQYDDNNVTTAYIRKPKMRTAWFPAASNHSPLWILITLLKGGACWKPGTWEGQAGGSQQNHVPEYPGLMPRTCLKKRKAKKNDRKNLEFRSRGCSAAQSEVS